MRFSDHRFGSGDAWPAAGAARGVQVDAGGEGRLSEGLVQVGAHPVNGRGHRGEVGGGLYRGDERGSTGCGAHGASAGLTCPGRGRWRAAAPH